jgi:hypothetical protein
VGGNRNEKNVPGIHFLNFVQVQQSAFRDMAIVDASDDNFSLGFWSSVQGGAQSRESKSCRWQMA